jgi:hypothetical protein
LADNPGIGLDETTCNILLTWSKFPDLENGEKLEPGGYANYVYAMSIHHESEEVLAFEQQWDWYQKMVQYSI